MSEWVSVEALAERLGVSLSEAQALFAQQTSSTQESAMPQETPIEPTKTAYQGLFLDKNDVQIFHDDFITSQSLPQESVDLIITSPPYNVGIEYSTHDDTSEYEHYLAFSRRWLRRAFEVSRVGGRMCLNIPLDKNKGGQQSVCADLTTIAKAEGWSYHSTIVWNEGNISRRTAWGSWMSATAPFVIAPVEVIVVLYKGTWKRTKRPNQESTITRDEFMAWTNGMWTFNGESKKRIGHPAPFPRELPRRCVKLFSFTGDTVLDPFAGSGTTLLEASDNGRHAVGFDIALEYCTLAQKRLTELWRNPKLI